MKIIILTILMSLASLCFSQNTPTTNLNTGEKEIEISNGRKIIGKSKFKIVLNDSISKEFGITELPANKLLFFDEEHSYVQSVISEINEKGFTLEKKYIIRVNHKHINFEKSKGQETYFQFQNYIKGFGEFYLSEHRNGELKYSIEKFSNKQKSSILMGLGTSVGTSLANLVYVSSVKNPRPIDLVTLNLVGGGITIYSIIRYLDSYKYLNRYNFYKEAIPLEDMKLK